MNFYKTLKRKQSMKRHPSSQPKSDGQITSKVLITLETSTSASSKNSYKVNIND